jgi:hypothetical protein
LYYTDISHFFDQAISELNTSFRIKLPLVSEMIDENRLHVEDLVNVAYLTTMPNATTRLPVYSEEASLDPNLAYYDPDSGLYYKKTRNSSEPVAFKDMYAVYLDSKYTRHVFKAIHVGDGGAMWMVFETSAVPQFDLVTYLPVDWIILFLIPYVCSKCSARDGNSGALYTEEYTQGFQQLQTSYDVPNEVLLRTVAHMPAYTSLAKQHLNNLNITVPVRAVTDTMKIGNAVKPHYGNVYNTGGWGI